MNHRLLYLFLIALVFHSCSKNGITLPPHNPDTNLINTKFIPDTVMKKMEGIYTVINSRGSLGSEFVCNISKLKVSFLR
jgi:hypothetical protein